MIEKKFLLGLLKIIESLSPSPSAYGSSPYTIITTSGLFLYSPFEENSAVPPETSTAFLIVSNIFDVLGNSEFKLSLPCQEIVHPPI